MKSIEDRVAYGFDGEVIAWVKKRIPGFTPSDKSRALGVIDSEKLIAGVVYDNWNGVHCEVSIAVSDRRWASRSVLRRLFLYPFDTLGCAAISVMVPSSNPQSINLATKLGFTGEAIIRYAAPDGSSLVVLKLFKEKCEWI